MTAAVLLLGHRGASAREPENTMRAFVRALDEGAEGIELDVRLCATGELAVFHDRTLLRRGGDPRAIGAVPWSEVRRLDVGAGERVPLLDDVLDLVRARAAVVNVEIKTNGPRGSEVAGALARTVGHWPGVELWASSFDPRAIALLSRRAPRLPRGLLFGAAQRWLLRSGVLAPLVGATAVHPERWLVDAARVAAWHASGRRVHAWTVDDPSELRRLASIGVDAAITNDPAGARAALG